MELTSCTVDLVRGRVVRGDAVVDLTSREVDLLRYLGANPSRVVPRDELLHQVWGYNDQVVTRACDNAVRRLREKVEADPARPDHVLTVHGVGYRFEPGGPAAPVVAAGETRWWTDLGAARVDLRRRVVEGPAGAGRLTEAEARVLERLVRANGAVVDRAELNRVAGTHGRAIDALVGQLRAKVEVDRADPRVLQTHRGGGYRLERAEPAPDALIGRASVLEALRRAHQGADWVLVVGPAGVGKSRLARQVAPNAVRVDLAAARTAAEAAARVAAALGLSLVDVDALGDALALRSDLVIVLDDLEALPGAAALIDRWRERAGKVRWLGTSRVRVGAAREVVIEVGPLDPDDAVALFVQRAQAASSADRVGDLGLVREIVDRLDRLPLAIELAAARTSTLGLADLRDRLSTALLVRPTGGDPRHHSLRSVVRASLEALPADALQALRQLASFRSGFFVDDAEALLGEPAVDLLQILRDHSLLHRLPDLDGAARFDTWQAVHELLEPDAEHLSRHAAYLALRGRDPYRLDAVGREGELRRTIAQVDDLAAAARQILPTEPQLAVGCAIAAGSVYLWRGPYQPGLALLDEVIAGTPPSEGRSYLRAIRSQLLVHSGASAEGRAGFREAAAEAAALDAPFLEAMAWRSDAYQAERFGDAEEARAGRTRALEVLTRAGIGDGWPEMDVGTLAPTPEARMDALRGAVAAGRASGNRALLKMALYRLASEATWFDRLSEARWALEGRFALAEPCGLESDQLESASLLCNLALKQDDAEQLERWGPVMAELSVRVGSRMYRMRSFNALAAAACARGRFAEADALAARAAELAIPGPDGRVELARSEIVRAEIALRAGDLGRAAELARRSHLGFGPVDECGQVIVALVAAGRGDLDQARAALAWEGPECREYWLVLRALVAAGEGRWDTTAQHLEALRVDFVRMERPGATDADRIAALVGRWAADWLEQAGAAGRSRSNGPE